MSRDTSARAAWRTGCVLSVAFACLGLAAVRGVAQTTVELAALERCASITSDAARLACYDAVTDVARGMAAPAAPPAASAASTGESARAEAAASPGVEAFGVEQVEDRAVEMLDEIHSRLVGEFSGWRGNTVFRLENGQVWRQSDNGRLVFQADAPLVTIRRGAFGTYRLSVEGVNSAVRVRRVE